MTGVCQGRHLGRPCLWPGAVEHKGRMYCWVCYRELAVAEVERYARSVINQQEGRRADGTPKGGDCCEGGCNHGS